MYDILIEPELFQIFVRQKYTANPWKEKKTP